MEGYKNIICICMDIQFYSFLFSFRHLQDRTCGKGVKDFYKRNILVNSSIRSLPNIRDKSLGLIFFQYPYPYKKLLKFQTFNISSSSISISININ